MEEIVHRQRGGCSSPAEGTLTIGAVSEEGTVRFCNIRLNDIHRGTLFDKVKRIKGQCFGVFQHFSNSVEPFLTCEFDRVKPSLLQNRVYHRVNQISLPRNGQVYELTREFDNHASYNLFGIHGIDTLKLHNLNVLAQNIFYRVINHRSCSSIECYLAAIGAPSWSIYVSCQLGLRQRLIAVPFEAVPTPNLCIKQVIQLKLFLASTFHFQAYHPNFLPSHFFFQQPHPPFAHLCFVFVFYWLLVMVVIIIFQTVKCFQLFFRIRCYTFVISFQMLGFLVMTFIVSF